MSDYVETSASLLRTVVQPRRSESHKGDNGKVAVVGGSRFFHGAPYFGSISALRSGADMVYVCVPRLIAGSIRSLSPELIVFPLSDAKLTKGAAQAFLKWVPDIDSLVIGPGLGRQNLDGVKKVVAEICLERNTRVTIDAEAQNTDVYQLIKEKNCITTPHPGEFKRVFGMDCGASLDEKIRATRSMAKDFGITIVLKGSQTVITDGDTVYVNSVGSPAMTCGGIGDTLSGVIGAFLAQNKNTQIKSVDIAAAASLVVGSAGMSASESKGFHIIASDIIEKIPEVLKPYDLVE